jgi:aspartate/tyrosine/aromatic aminotransferase
MFKEIKKAEDDPILGLTEEFKTDHNKEKVNLAVGVYQDDLGNTPSFGTVLEAEEFIFSKNYSKTYKPIDGDKLFTEKSIELVLGNEIQAEKEGLLFGLNTPGGTGALRLASDFLKTFTPNSSIWISDPSWPNHKSIFEASGFQVKSYPYFDADNNNVDFDSLISQIKEIPRKDIVVIHGCCHNPTGSDLSKEQWSTLADIILEKELLPICDFAYQGLGNGIEEDAAGVRILTKKLKELIICTSFSKNFGLYSERVGSLIFFSESAQSSASVLSQLKKTARSNYSNPPAHGSDIVKTILNNSELRSAWIAELDKVRGRIRDVRASLVDQLLEEGCKRDFSFIKNQNGMFSLLV